MMDKEIVSAPIDCPICAATGVAVHVIGTEGGTVEPCDNCGGTGKYRVGFSFDGHPNAAMFEAYMGADEWAAVPASIKAFLLDNGMTMGQLDALAMHVLALGESGEPCGRVNASMMMCAIAELRARMANGQTGPGGIDSDSYMVEIGGTRLKIDDAGNVVSSPEVLIPNLVDMLPLMRAISRTVSNGEIDPMNFGPMIGLSVDLMLKRLSMESRYQAFSRKSGVPLPDASERLHGALMSLTACAAGAEHGMAPSALGGEAWCAAVLGADPDQPLTRRDWLRFTAALAIEALELDAVLTAQTNAAKAH